MLFSGLYFNKCYILKVLISRNYRGDIDMAAIEKFMPLVMEREDDGQLAPIIQVRSYTIIIL